MHSEPQLRPGKSKLKWERVQAAEARVFLHRDPVLVVPDYIL